VDYDWADPRSSYYALEAVKAQAVAARTYALATMAARSSHILYDNQNDQCYVGYSGRSKPGETPFEVKYPGIPQAAEETAGLVLTYQGKPITAYFSAHSGGYTSWWAGNTQPPAYLPYQPDSWSRKAPPTNPGYKWTYTVSTSELSQKVNGHLRDTSGKLVDLGLINKVEVYERDKPSDPESHA
ncbi:MAG: SpoIID/LytB domain-containing protein, partial [Thermoleophilia bacterium]|nr:SpoIID/LytB domain-containing protein [Thermoleophilia bacterium]